MRASTEDTGQGVDDLMAMLADDTELAALMDALENSDAPAEECEDFR